MKVWAGFSNGSSFLICQNIYASFFYRKKKLAMPLSVGVRLF